MNSLTLGPTDWHRIRVRAVLAFIGAGVMALVLTAYQDHEIKNLDDWLKSEQRNCNTTADDYLSCSAKVDRQFSDQYYPMFARALVFEVAGTVCIFIGLSGAALLWWRRRRTNRRSSANDD